MTGCFVPSPARSSGSVAVVAVVVAGVAGFCAVFDCTELACAELDCTELDCTELACAELDCAEGREDTLGIGTALTDVYLGRSPGPDTSVQ